MILWFLAAVAYIALLFVGALVFDSDDKEAGERG